MIVKTLSLASFFSIEARDYSNFTFDADARATVRNVIIGFAIGILVAALFAFYQKNVPGAIVHALLRAEAFSAETAKSATELGIGRNIFILFELKHNGMLKKLLVRVPQTDENGEEAAADAATDRYYIPEGLKYRAEIRYDKKGNGPVALAITAVLTVALAILLIRLMPALLSVADNLLG